MKKVIVLSLALAVATFSASAQQTRESKGHKDQQASQHKGRMMNDLNLTDEQKASMKADREAMKVKMDAIKNDPNLTAEQKKEKAKSMMQEERSKMQSILTAEQRAKMDAQRETMKKKRSEMDSKRGEMNQRKEMGKDRGMTMKDELNLSNAQASQLKALHEQTREKVQAVQNNASLTQEQKTAQIKTIKAATKTQSESILTKEQQEKMKSMKKDFKGKRGMHDKMKGDHKNKTKKPQTT